MLSERAPSAIFGNKDRISMRMGFEPMGAGDNGRGMSAGMKAGDFL
jgi:hypothetical protein